MASAHDESRLRAVMDAALPALLDMVCEHLLAGAEPGEIAGCVIQPEPATPLGTSPRTEVLLVSRRQALEVARQVAPDHAHLLESPAAPGQFHVVAVAGALGAVVALGLPGARPS